MLEKAKSDSSLLRSFQNGSLKAFSELYSRYYKLAFRSAFLVLSSKEDAEDAAENFFVSFFERKDGFDPSRPFGPYVFAGAKNMAINIAKKREFVPEKLTHEEIAGDDEKRLAVSTKLMDFLRSLLSDDELSVYLLHVAFSYSFREIGEMTSTSEDSASSRFFRAKAKVDKADKPTFLDD